VEVGGWGELLFSSRSLGTANFAWEKNMTLRLLTFLLSVKELKYEETGKLVGPDCIFVS
jgi:hypothetical protein